MKNHFRLFAIFVGTIIFFSVWADGAGGQIFEKDIDWLKKNVLPIPAAKKHSELISFVNVALPALDKVIESNAYHIKDNLGKISRDITIQKDFLIFAYNRGLSLYRRNVGAIGYGDWNDEIRKYVFFLADIICTIEEFINLKDVAYKSEMSKVNVMLVRGTYESTLKWLSLTPSFYQLQLGPITADKKYPRVEEILIKELLEFGDRQRGQK